MLGKISNLLSKRNGKIPRRDSGTEVEVKFDEGHCEINREGRTYRKERTLLENVRGAKCLKEPIMQAAAQKGYKGAGMEGRTARWYARTRQNEMEDFRKQAKRVAERLRKGCDVLEVAPGPGYFAVELAKLGNFRITGLDISKTFVEISTENARKAGVKIDFRPGNVSAMPFADESIDVVYCSAAFKNFTEPVKALNEMHRVLRPDGEALISDLRKDVSLQEIDSYVRASGRSWFDAWLTKMAFKHMLIRRAYTKEDFERMAKESKFGASEIETSSISIEVNLKKKTVTST